MYSKKKEEKSGKKKRFEWDRSPRLLEEAIRILGPSQPKLVILVRFTELSNSPFLAPTIKNSC